MARMLKEDNIISCKYGKHTVVVFQGQLSLNRNVPVSFTVRKLDTTLPSVTTVENTADSSELPRNKSVTAQPHVITWRVNVYT